MTATQAQTGLFTFASAVCLHSLILFYSFAASTSASPCLSVVTATPWTASSQTLMWLTCNHCWALPTQSAPCLVKWQQMSTKRHVFWFVCFVFAASGSPETVKVLTSPTSKTTASPTILVRSSTNNHQMSEQQSLSRPGNSLLRSALTGKTSYLLNKQQQQQQQSKQQSFTAILPPPPSYKVAMEQHASNNNKMEESKVEEILMLAKKRTLESQSGTSGGTVQITNGGGGFSTVFSNNNGPDGSNRYTVNICKQKVCLHILLFCRLVINTANLLSTAASQLKLTPPGLGSLVPVSSAATAGDSNNNIKNNIPPPPSVISFVVDVGNNNNSNNNSSANSTTSASATMDDGYTGGSAADCLLLTSPSTSPPKLC